MRTVSNRQIGFTLIELLVVTAIIAVLAALLMPALKSAKDRGKTTKCANNERQIGVGTSGYLADHSGYYPYGDPAAVYDCGINQPGINSGVIVICPAFQPTNYVANLGWSAAYRYEWKYCVDQYLGKNIASSLWRCPSNPWPFPTTAAASEYAWSYLLNDGMFPQNWYSICGSGLPASPTAAGWQRRMRVTDISAPAKVFFAGERPYCASGTATPYGSGGINAAQNGRCSEISWGNFQTPRCCAIPYIAPLPYNEYGAWWHNVGMNCLFVDGHAERVSLNTLTNYAASVSVGGPCPGGVCAHYYVGDGSPGCYFWNDNRGTQGPYANQPPGAPYGRQWAGE